MTWAEAQSTLALIGMRVRLYRLRAGLTQDELARRTKGALGRTSIVNIEKGRQKMTVLSLVTVANGLGVAPGDLLLPMPLPDTLVEIIIGGVTRKVSPDVADQLLEASEEQSMIDVQKLTEDDIGRSASKAGGCCGGTT